METKSVKIQGRKGKWGIIETEKVMGLTFGMAEHEVYGDETDLLLCILESDGNWKELDILCDDLHRSIEEWLENAVWSYITDKEWEDKNGN
nr:hypothetical protein [uncultured Sphaerochaeta sp.]